MRPILDNFFYFLLALLINFTLSGCMQADEKFKSYSIGFTTQGQEVSVDAVHIDNQWSVPGGVSISGVWGEASGGASVFDKTMPHEIRINWVEKGTKNRYEATVKLVDDLSQRARSLPKVTYIPTNDQNVGTIDLIVGIESKGKVTVWLSNYPYPRFISGRVLEVIGEAQGKLTEQLPPYYPTSKTNL